MDNEAYQTATPLFRAITDGNASAVQKLLAAGEDANESYGIDDESALMVAAVEGRAEIVKLLLDAGANPNQGDMHGYTPLLSAVCADSLPAVELLIAAGADIHARCGKSGANALQDAAAGCHVEITHALLHAGADANADETEDGLTTLMCAVQALCPALVELLLEHGADAAKQSSRGDTALQLLSHIEGDLWLPKHVNRARKIRARLEAALQQQAAIAN